MKAKKIMTAWLILAVIFLFNAGINLAFAYDVKITNTTNQKIYLNVYVRPDPSWGTFATGLVSPNPEVGAGQSYTFQIPVERWQSCPAYFIGYNADYSSSIVTMGCDGTEGNMSSRCCAFFNLEVYKNSSDNRLHFRKL